MTYEFDLDVTPGSVPVVVPLKQYCDDTLLVFNVYSRLGDLELKSGTTVAIRGTKSDGNGISIDVSLSGNVVSVSVNKQMVAVAGKSLYELVFTKDGKEFITASFIVFVQRAALDKDTLRSGSVIKELVNVIDRTDEIIAAANKADEAYKGAIVIKSDVVAMKNEVAETGRQIGLLKANLDDLDERVTDIEAGGGGGSGGSSTLAGLTDTSISNKEDGQVLTYDVTSHKWINKTPAAAAANSLVVTVSGTGVHRTCDKTYTEIYNAISTGKIVVAVDGTGVVYPYARLIERNGTTAIAFGISVVYDKTATSTGYLIVDTTMGSVAIRQDQTSSFYDTSETYTRDEVASYVSSRLGIYYTRSQIDEKIGDIETLLAAI